MKRHLLALFALAALLTCPPIESAHAVGGGGHGGHGHGFGHGRGFGGGLGFGIGGAYNDIYGLAELYRELYNNLPFYALHPPVYYSEPVPRTYGYSPFAYPPGVMTPEIVTESKPVTIINPHVPGNNAPAASPTSAATNTDRSAATTTPEPLVIINPFVTPTTGVAKSGL